MATVAGVKIANKVKKTRNPLFFDEKYTGGEPVWDTERALKMDDAEFDHHLRKSFYYYNYYYTQKETKKYIVEWAKTTEKYSHEQIRAYERTSDKSMPMTACSLILANRIGMPFRERHIEFLHKCLLEAIETSEPEIINIVSPEVAAYRPTIQDRLNEKTSELIGTIEGHYDDVVNNVKVDFKPYDFLVANTVPQGQLFKYEKIYSQRKDELVAAQNKQDDLLVEGYKHYRTADFKRVTAFIDDLMSAIDQYRGVKKATKKLRVKKAPSTEKLVARLKYAKEDKTLKVISINPADIIGSQELWCFDTRTRKLFKYVAASYQTLTIKGTSIVNFDVDKSVGKTVRKPEETLKEFFKAGKVQLRKFLDTIKAVEVKANGRINENQLLLKVL
jgi:hypothetical protein